MATEQLQWIISVDDNGSANIRRFTASVEGANAAGRRFTQTMGGLATGSINLAAKLFVLKESFHLVERAYERLIKPTVEAGEQLLNLSRRFGVTVSELSGFQKFAAAAGVNIGELTYALRQFNVALAGVDKPGSQAARIFRQVGIDGKNLRDSAEGISEKIKKVVDAFSDFKDSPQRFSALVALFGRNAQLINQIINTGTRETRRELERFAKEFGVSVDAATALAADRLKTNLRKVRIVEEGIFRRFATSDLIGSIANIIDERATAVGKFFKNIPADVIENVNRVILSFVRAVPALIEAVAKLSISPTVIKSFENLANVIQRVADAMERVNRGEVSIGEFFKGAASFLGGGGGAGLAAGLLTKAAGGGFLTQAAVGGATAALSAGAVPSELRTSATTTALIAGAAITIASSLPLSISVPAVLLTVTGASAFANEAIKRFNLTPEQAAAEPRSKFFDFIDNFGGAVKAFVAAVDAWDSPAGFQSLFGISPPGPSPQGGAVGFAPLPPEGEAFFARRRPRTPADALAGFIASQRRGQSLLNPPGAALQSQLGPGEQVPRSFPDQVDEAKIAQLTRKLTELNAVNAAGADVVKRFDAEIDAQVQSMVEAARGAEGLGDKLRHALADKQAIDALIKFNDELRKLQGQLRVAIDPSQTLAVELADVRHQFEALLGAKDVTNEKKRQLETLQDAVLDLHKELNAVEGTHFGQKIQDQLDEIVTPTSALTHEFRELRKEASKFPVELDANLAKLDRLETLKRTIGGFVDVFGAFRQAFDDIAQAIVQGTLDMSQVFQSLKVSIVKSFVDAFAEGFKAKLGFEAAFKVNIVQFLSNLGNVISGRSGSGGGLTGVLGSLVQGVFLGGGGSGGVLGSLGSVVGGGGGGGTVPILSSSGQVVGFTQGVPNVPTGGLFNRPINWLGRVLGLGGSASGLSALGNGTLGGATVAGQSLGGGIGALGGGSLFTTAAGNVVEILPPSSTFASTSALTGEAATGPVANAGASALGGLLSAVAAITSVISLALTAKSNIDTSRGFSRATLGAPEATNFAIGSGIGVGVGAGVGGAVGFAAGGPLGAIIGAAIGAAIAQLIASTTARGIANGVSTATKKGLNQAQFEKVIHGDTGIQILFGTQGGTGGFKNPLGGGFAAPIAGNELLKLFIPSIEVIFDKLFEQFVGRFLPVNRNLGGFLGQGVTRPGEVDELKRIEGDARILSRIIATLIGAGRDAWERIDRFTNVLLNSIGRLKGNAEAILDRLFRTLTGNRLLGAVALIDRVFPEKEGTEGRTTAFDFARKSFEKVLPGVDVGSILDVFDAGRFTRRSGGRPGQSQKAVASAVGALFSGDTPEQGLVAFGNKLADVVREAFVKGMSKLLLKPVLGDLLADLFGDLKRDLRRLRQGKDKDFGRLTKDINEDAAGITKLLTTPGLTQLLATSITAEKKLEQAIADALLTAQAQSGDLAGLRDTIEGRLAKPTAIRDGFRALGEELGTRVAVAVAGGGFGGDEARVSAAQRAANRAEERFKGFVDAVGGQAAAARPENIERSLGLLKEFVDLRLSSLEAELDLARRQKEAFTQLKKFGESVVDQVDVLRRGRGAQFDILARTRNRATEAFGRFSAAQAGGDTQGVLAAAADLQDLIPQLLQLGQQLLAPGGSEMANLLDFIDSVGKTLTGAGVGGENAAETRIRQVTSKLDELKDAWGPIITFFEGQAQVNLAGEFDKIATRLGNQGPIKAVLDSIARQLGVHDIPQGLETSALTTPESIAGAHSAWITDLANRFHTTPAAVQQYLAFVNGDFGAVVPLLARLESSGQLPARAWGGPVEPMRPYWVGERGPEIFVPRSAGRVLPAGGGGGDINVVLGPVTVEVNGAGDPEATARQVATALRLRLVPQLRDEIARVR